METKIVVVGLGYVGLPVAVAAAESFPDAQVVGFDINPQLIETLTEGTDPSQEVPAERLQASGVEFTTHPVLMAGASVIVVAVPTPIDDTRRPDLSALMAATRAVGDHMDRGALVVFESTVFPGCTRDRCVPVLRAALERRFGECSPEEPAVAYSPERVVPGDAMHTLERVDKLVAGLNPRDLETAVGFYEAILDDGRPIPVASLEIAEAAKVLENTQRDLNIALMNEMALIFRRAGIDTNAVIDAAATKWNFHPYRPGLVGGHCIGVDPYYLTYLAEQLGYRPEVVLAGRRINDGMGRYIAQQTVRACVENGRSLPGARIAVLGVTFKENVADVRNSRVVELVNELCAWGVDVQAHDPIAAHDSLAEFGIPIQQALTGPLDGVVLAVAHDSYREPAFLEDLGAAVRHGDKPAPFMDVKSLFVDRVPDVERHGFAYWRL